MADFVRIGPTYSLTEIPDGNPGNAITLSRLRALIRRRSPVVDLRARLITELAEEPEQQFIRCFAYVRSHMTYLEDERRTSPFPILDTLRSGESHVEDISSPDVLLWLIDQHGTAEGDCDDYVSLLGALLYSLGHRVSLVGISTRPDSVWNHIYLSAYLGDGYRIPLDPSPEIRGYMHVWHPLGWEPPDRTVTSKVEVRV